MGKSIGIDLGTTNTAIAVIIDGRPRVLEDEKGYKVLPSCVSWKGEGRYVIGQAAKNLILSAPGRTVHAVKRLMGRRFDSPEVQRTRERVGFDIVQAPDGGVAVRLGEETLTPAEVSSIILQVARQIAERALGEAIDEAVITVPAYFTHAQREATLEAARLAGLHCERLINEPTAAALAYGYRKDLDRQLLIYDLGGGTLDVCVLRLAEGVYESLASRGDSFLGGEDFDYRLVDHLADHFQSKHGVDLREDRVSKQRLKDAAERAKCELSFTDRTTVLVPRAYEDINLELVVSRPTLEALVEDLVSRTIEITRRTLDDAGLAASEVDDVILVGGQTRMPKVREAITGLFGREPNRSVHPEEVVAVGAAVHANTLADATGGAVLLDITPFDLGIDSVGGMFAPIIPRNSKIPASRTRAFATVHDNQERVRVVVRQGEHIKAEENEFLGEFVMEGITPQPAMEAKVNVTFRLDANGMLHIQATEVATGERKQITIRNYAQLVAGEGEGGAASSRPEIVGDQQKPHTEIHVPASSGSGETLVPIEPAPPPQPARSSRFASLFGRMFGGRGKPAAEGLAADGAPSQGPVHDVRLVGEAQVGTFSEEAPPPPPSQPAPAAPAAPEGVVPYSDIGIDISMATPPAVATLEPGEFEDLPAMATVDEDLGAPPRAASLGLAGEALSSLSDAPSPWDDDIDALPLGNLGAEDMAGLDDAELEESPLWSPAPRPRTSAPAPAEPPKQPRKPARLKMNYRSLDAFVVEYRDNLSRGGTFIRTPKPLSVGRECAFEVRIPGEEAPLVFEGVVTWSSASLPELSAGQEEGMGIEFRLDAATRARMEALVARGVKR
ncbi:MAG: Hsp70 family protein [Pseudomonadota bacterium]